MAERQSPYPGREELDAEISLPDGDWQLVPFQEITTHTLKPFEVITDIPSLTAFNTVEEQIGHTIIDPYAERLHAKMYLDSPEYTGPDDGYRLRMLRVMADRISNRIRPKSFNGRPFNGSLLNARVIMLPFNPIMTARLMPGTRTRTPFTDTTPGLSVIYAGDLYSSGRPLGTVLQDVYYCDPQLVLEKPNPDSFLLRTLGPKTTTTEVFQAIDKTVADSQETARAVAEFSLRNLYRAGLPGLGKR